MGCIPNRGLDGGRVLKLTLISGYLFFLLFYAGPVVP
jgi:hypothetical protein